MEVTGKTQNKNQCQAPASVLSNVRRVFCHPCSDDGESVEADGFCQNCQEYLCGTCIKYHRKVTVSKHHTILDKANMPTNVAPKSIKQLCTETCHQHNLEVIKYYCKDHDAVGCGNCMVIDHKACKVEFIPDIAEEFLNGEEHKALLSKLEDLQEKVASKLKTTKDGKRVCYQDYDAAVHEIKKFRKDIEAYLNRMEESLVKECERIRIENENIIKESEDFLKVITSELINIDHRLKSQSKKTSDMFVEAKKASARIDRLDEVLEIEKDCIVTHYTFQRNKDLDMVTSGTCPLGDLTLHSEGTSIVEFNPVFSHDINVKSKSDKAVSVLISNMLPLSSDKLLCVDRNNKSLKVVDTKQKCISSEIRLESGPWDITFISVNQVAVTLPDSKKIIFLSIRDNNLASENEVGVDGKCRGITSNQKTLVVSFDNPSKLQTLTMKGEVIHTFSAENLGWCGCLVVSDCGNYFFSSDVQKHYVKKFSFDGNVSATYEDTFLKSPRSMARCRDGSLLVCSSENNKLHLMSQDCQKIKILPLENHRLNKLQSVCYNETTSTMYLSNFTEGYLLVYKQA